MYSFMSFVKVILYMIVIQGSVKILKDPMKSREFSDKVLPIMVMVVGVLGVLMEVSSWF